MDAIIQGLDHWHHPPNPTTTIDFMAEGWDDQNQIRWEGMLNSWVAQSWNNQQGLIWATDCLWKSSW